MPQTEAAPGAPLVTAPIAEAPTLWLEISRGRTQHPKRPLLWPRFLIGAGSNCHLQLGGDGVPFLHSIIDTTGSVARVEAFTAWPELRINGAVVQTTILTDGDEVEIGPFAFRFHREACEVMDPVEADPEPMSAELAEIPEEDPASLSAAELISRIEAMETEVNEFESLERSGSERLLAAVRQWSPLNRSTEQPAPVETEEQLAGEIASITQEVEQRLAQLRQWEAEQVARADALLSAQDRLAEQLRLAAQSLAREQARTRVSA